MFFLPMIDNLPLHHGHGRCYSMSKVNLVFHIHLNVYTHSNIFIGEMLFFICMNINFYWRNQPCILIYIQRKCNHTSIFMRFSCSMNLCPFSCSMHLFLQHLLFPFTCNLIFFSNIPSFTLFFNYN